MTDQTRPWCRRILALLVASAFVLAACGDDDDGTAESSEPAPTETETEDTDAAGGADADAGADTETDSGSNTDTGAAGDDVAAVATANGATFVPSYAQYAPGFAAAVAGPGPVTALVPSDGAFAAFSSAYPELTNELRSDFDALDQVLLYHLVDGAQLQAALESGGSLVTLQGEEITVAVVDGVVEFNDGQARIEQADLEASNGVVHILDGILLPPSMAADAG